MEESKARTGAPSVDGDVRIGPSGNNARRRTVERLADSPIPHTALALLPVNPPKREETFERNHGSCHDLGQDVPHTKHFDERIDEQHVYREVK